MREEGRRGGEGWRKGGGGWRRESIQKRDGGETKGRRKGRKGNETRGVRIKEEFIKRVCPSLPLATCKTC